MGRELTQLVKKHFHAPSGCQAISGIKWLKEKKKKKKVAESCLSLVGKTEKKTDFTVTSTMTDQC